MSTTSARPGARVGVVVTDAYPAEDPDHDTAPLVAALRAQGIDAGAAVWHDAGVDWAAYDLLVLRSPWDYPERLAEFLAWLDRAESVTRVLNPPALVRWNLDKRYLAQLADLGVGVVPTAYRTSLDDVRADLAAAAPGARVVLKPAVSAGARDTGLFGADDPGALDLAARILDGGRVVMVQPEVPELSAGREKALYVVDGRLTHAISKGALLAPGGGFLGGVYAEHPVPVDVTADEAAFAQRVVAAVGEATGLGVPLYARVDTVDSADHGLVLLEAELFEPALNLHVAPEATGALVAAVRARLVDGGTGGGPAPGGRGDGTTWSQRWERTRAQIDLLPRPVRLVAVSVVGGTVLLTGVAMLVLPGPGILAILAGLALLATEFAWARRWLDRARAAGRQGVDKGREVWGRRRPASGPTTQGDPPAA
ncbi:PGPGW domain-containing protein [Cellulomonas dongxiuzhuiae]|uniref:PGPGW domain-containing protein n=1 Tax=Cellulomonas dongxiuzhuiae TaxID=2819979 RepID=UPI0027DC83FF|nr:PGPGW domain-containing protein [Cellulomonas dongxiuzhuiae]